MLESIKKRRAVQELRKKYFSVLVALLAACSGGGAQNLGRSSAGIVTASIISGNNQLATAGSRLPNRFQLKVVVGKIPSAGVTIDWSTTGGTLDLISSTTDQDGTSIGPQLILPETPGEVTVTADILSPSGTAKVDFRATGIRGAASRLVFVQQPSDSVQFKNFASDIKVQIEDAAGNLIENAVDPITLVLDQNSARANILGPATISAQAGIATFPGISIDKIGTGYTIKATAEGLASVVSQPFAIADPTWSLGPCSSRNNPSSAIVGTTVDLTLCVTNRAGVSVGGVVVTWSPVSAGGTLNATTSITDAQGVATMPYTLASLVGPNTVNAKINIGARLVPSTIEIAGTPGAAMNLVFVQEPTDAKEYKSFANVIKLVVQDANGNINPDANEKVNLSFQDNPTAANLVGTTEVTLAGGEVRFPDVYIDKVGAGYALKAIAIGLTPAVSAAFAVTDIGLQAVALPGSLDGGKVAQKLAKDLFLVKVLDNTNSPVGGVNVSWAVKNGDASVSQPFQTVSGPDGVARSPEITLSSFVEVNTIFASITNHPGGAPATFVVKGYPKLVQNPTWVTTVSRATNFDIGVALINDARTTQNMAPDRVVIYATQKPSGSLVKLQEVVAEDGKATFKNLRLNSAGNFELSVSVLKPDGNDPKISTISGPLTVP